MARRINKPTHSTAGDTDSNPIRVERVRKFDLRQSLRTCGDVLRSSRFRLIAGIVLLAVALMLLIAYISFFFTGANDYSIIENAADRRAMRTGITNALGLPGAVISRGLVDGAFGIVAILPILALGVYAARLLFEFPLKGWKVLFITLFGMFWGSIVLGFAQQMTGIDTFFRWGGAHGQIISEWATSYIQWLGLLLILVGVLVVFLIVIDRHFVDNCRRFGQWCKGLFARKPKPQEEPQDTDTQEDTDDTPLEIQVEPDSGNTIHIDIADAGSSAPESASSDAITVTIENTRDPEEEPSDTPIDPEAQGDFAQRSTLNAQPEDIPDFNIEEPQDVELSEQDPDFLLHKLGPYDPRKDLENYHFPPLNLLKVYDNETAPVINQDEQQANANRIVTTLRNFGIEIDSIKATVGPTVTLYELVPKAGVKISKIQNLENDIMLSLSATGIRIIAPMPGKGTIGIEVPNEKPQTVSMHSVIASKRFQDEQKMRLPIAIGRTITNEVFLFDLAKTPHLLVAGATGQGKSVAINAILTSLLYKKHPAELKLVLVDPKMVEFSPYKELYRHYLAAMPDVEEQDIIITDCDKVINTLNSLVIEMENRYKLLMDAGVRNLEDYNDKFVKRRLNPEKLVADSLHHRYLPYIVIVIDEYGDFIMQAGKQVETPIARITQKARAVGMHMILATQRPSVNIVTGVIKANIPTRIALRTQSVIDSRTVLDAKGAEQLIGRGDMLYAGNGNITRIQCAFVDTPEVDAIVDYIKEEQHYFEPYQLPEYIPEGQEDAVTPGSVDMKRLDPMFADVARYVVAKQEGSTSRLQRAFEIGYNRAGKLSDQLEAAGIVGPNKGPKGRDVLIQDMDMLEQKLQDLGAV